MLDAKPSWYLREWRTYLGFTQERLATLAGMHKGDVSRLERFDPRWNETHLAKFSIALGIRRWWLIEVNPFDPGNDLALLDAVKRVPRSKLHDLRRIINALAESDQNDSRPDVIPEPAPPKRRKRAR